MKTEKKNYFTFPEFVDAILERAKADVYWPNDFVSGLDYLKKSFGLEEYKGKDEIRFCEFDVVSMTRYGGSEGIYTTVTMDGYVDDPKNRKIVPILTLKHLDCTKDVYLQMHHVGALLSYHGNQIVGENLDRFD